MLPREKLLLKGIDALSDTELIEILVGSGIKGSDFKQISRKLLSSIKKSIKEKKGINLDQLLQIRGVGEVVGMRIVTGIELGRRVYGMYDVESVRIANAKEAYEIFKDMSHLKKERVDVVCLNSRFEYICRETVAVGSLNCASVVARDVLYPAISNSAAFVILAHNHPSGDSTPSMEDIEFTNRMIDALNLVGIQLLDHIIVGKIGWNTVNI
jgi:DNA repair protein RadC